MTMMAVKEGVFRAYAPIDNRGRRKRRGEFMPVSTASTFATARVPVMRDETEITFPTPIARSAELDGVSELRVQYDGNSSGKTTLVMSGTLDLSTVLPFRDAVFTAIGAKPPHLVVDMTRIKNVDVAGISALVTAGRVAKLMKVSFSVLPSSSLKVLMEETRMSLDVSP
jgi:ABC-type transporter Mla MlaB component